MRCSWLIVGVALLSHATVASAQRRPGAAGASPRIWVGIEESVGVVGSPGITYKGGSTHIPAATLGLLMRPGVGLEVGVLAPRELLVQSRQADPRPSGINFNMVSMSVARLSARGGDLTTSALGIAAIRPQGQSTITGAAVAAVQGDVHRTRYGAVTLGARGWYSPNARGTTMWSAAVGAGWRMR